MRWRYFYTGHCVSAIRVNALCQALSAAEAETDEGKEIVGIVFLWKKDSGVPWLGIGIAEKWKGKHLGRRLMDTARQYAESKGAGGIMLTTAQTNFRGQGLYEHMGYEKLGVHHSGEFLYLLTL